MLLSGCGFQGKGKMREKIKELDWKIWHYEYCKWSQSNAFNEENVVKKNIFCYSAGIGEKYGDAEASITKKSGRILGSWCNYPKAEGAISQLLGVSLRIASHKCRFTVIKWSKVLVEECVGVPPYLEWS